jgi:hypothetical protein
LVGAEVSEPASTVMSEETSVVPPHEQIEAKDETANRKER